MGKVMDGGGREQVKVAGTRHQRREVIRNTCEKFSALYFYRFTLGLTDKHQVKNKAKFLDN